MKIGFYPRLAMNGIRKNKRLYFPYILTGSVMVMMYYILSFLASTEMLEHMKGGGSLRTMLPFGCAVIGIFGLIFLFYTNSFLIRQRNQEFGLYNILGMDKGNLSRVMFWENLLVAGISIACGLALGIGLSKLAELAMLNILAEPIDFSMRVDRISVRNTALLFCGIYLVLLFNALIRVAQAKPMELLRSAQVGEKPPRANWLLAILGAVVLIGAYYLAVSIRNPLDAIVWFFVAVVMVILATYLLFISGSVAFCRLLQKSKRYYYRPNHFVSVSSMVYRMKRNGAGLASICILLTMVLVTLASTASLYIGGEDSLNTLYPKDMALCLSLPGMEYYNGETFATLREAVTEKVPDQKNIVEFGSGEIAGQFTPEGIQADPESHSSFRVSTYDQVGYLWILSLSDYNRMMGANETLEKDECLLYCLRTEFTGSTFSVDGGAPLRVKRVLEDMDTPGNLSVQIVPFIVLITDDFQSLAEPLLSKVNTWGNPVLELSWNYSFDMDGTAKEQIEAYDCLLEEIRDIGIRGADGSYSYSIDGKEEGRAAFYGLYGGLFFIGVLLSAVFLFAAVLIIYYKQISEGFEDQKRFAVMRKVGMTRREIRSSINSQMLTVFFLPLVTAGLHLCFAFPMIRRLLLLFNLTNVGLLAGCTAVCYLIFALFYMAVYRATSNAYFHIVSGSGE